jgi:hypothetical protein
MPVTGKWQCTGIIVLVPFLSLVGKRIGEAPRLDAREAPERGVVVGEVRNSSGSALHEQNACGADGAGAAWGRYFPAKPTLRREAAV